MKNKLIMFIMGMCLSMHSLFAACEREAREYSDWTQKCNNATTAANAACIAGFATCWFTFGATLAAPATLVPVAMNMCRIRDEKSLNLAACQRLEQARATESAAQVTRLEQRTETIRKLVEFQRKLFGQSQEETLAGFDFGLRMKLEEHAAEGFDLESEEAIQYVRELTEKNTLLKNEWLVKAEGMRKAAVADALRKINQSCGLDSEHGLSDLSEAGVI